MKSSTFPTLPPCVYCHEPCFNAEGAPTPKDSHSFLFFFCTPECICAYNKYHLNGNQESHNKLQQFFGRTVFCAPPRYMLTNFVRRRGEGLCRNVWLPDCYSLLTEEERKLIHYFKKEDLRITKK